MQQRRSRARGGYDTPTAADGALPSVLGRDRALFTATHQIDPAPARHGAIFIAKLSETPSDTEAKVARTVVVTDDLDGSSPAEPVQFTYDGVNWEIDLSAKNREKLQKALQPFLDKAHRAHMAEAKTTTPTRTRRSRSAKNGREDLDAIRQWAQENGYKVGDRGRIAKSIIEEYKLAQKAKR